MTVGESKKVQGYVTQDKFLVGRSLSELERYLGFQTGRLSRGATFLRLDRLPGAAEFELAAYSMTAAHRHVTPPGLDISKLKALAMARWTLAGPDRLVKVWPQIQHDDNLAPDDQYPPGSGVPQWRLSGPIEATIVAEVKTASDKYLPML